MVNLKPSLPAATWQTLYAVMMDDPVAFRARRDAIQAFEGAMMAAQHPPPPPPAKTARHRTAPATVPTPPDAAA